MIARIAVASAVFSMDKPFDYRIPDSLTLQPGQRVRVPFGASNRRTEGIVLAVMPDGAERPDGPALFFVFFFTLTFPVHFPSS